MRIRTTLFIIVSLILSCNQEIDKNSKKSIQTNGVELVVLGTAQDAGAPQINCVKSCCVNKKKEHFEPVVSLGLMDYTSKQHFIFEATPNLPEQWAYLNKLTQSEGAVPNGIFLTHAHIGHYTGLMYLGREAMNASKIPVYVLPKMASFLERNGPWSQLINLQNIKINKIQPDSLLEITSQINVIPLLVPHRDEFSETVGYMIVGKNKKALFIPDIDKWKKWHTDILALIKKVDYAFLDATFYDGAELPGRNMNEIPHPFIVESMSLFKELTPKERNKVYFIHFNHSNPVLDKHSEASKKVEDNGFNMARKGMRFKL